jgi:hypothetical protein
METDEEVKELEELLSKSKFKPIESPIVKLIKKLKGGKNNV